MANYSKLNSNIKNNIFSIVTISFILLVLLGLIEGHSTLHQKVFKSYLLCWFDTILFAVYAIQVFVTKTSYEKKRKFFLYFIFYFLFILIQYIVTFFSGEISYDREYYLGNYIALILFAMSFYLLANDFEDLNLGLIIISLFTLIIIIWTFILLAKSGFKFNKVVRETLKFSFGNVDYFTGYYVGVWPLSLLSGLILYKNFEQKSNSKNAKIISGILLAIGIIGFFPLLLSKTRAAQFGWFVSFFFIMAPSLFIIYAKKISKPLRFTLGFAIPIFVTVLVIVLLSYPTPLVKKLFGRLVETMANPAYQIHDRLNGWEGGLNLFKHHPIFGAGLGTLYPSSFKYMNNMFYMYSGSNSFKHAHSEYVEVLGEGGLFGEIFFFSLFLFIIVSMLVRVFSEKYKKEYRLTCLGVAGGIVAMLFHQMFCLSLRMTVTMIAYYSLLGLGIFLISISKSQLIAITDENQNNVVISNQKTCIFSKILSFLNVDIKYIEKVIIVCVMLFGTGMGFFLMHWTHQCEMNTVKAMGSKSLEEVELYFKKANTIMPGNPYAWTQKYVIESNVLQQMLSSPQNNKGYYEYVESLFTEIRNDIDKMNGIIYGYQNTWQKLANLEIQEYQYYYKKYQQTSKVDAYKAFLSALANCINDYTKSIEQNYLDINGRALQIVAINMLDLFLTKNTDLVPFVREYVQAFIYLNYARANKILASRIHISLSDTDASTMSMQKVKGKNNYYFVINDNDVKSLAEKCRECVNVSELSTTVNNVLLGLYDKKEFKELMKK